MTRSRARTWLGLGVSGFAALFLFVDAIVKVLLLAPAVENTGQLGYPISTVRPIGILELMLLVVYLVPRTSVAGAVLWTGYLGGAVATQVRVGNPLLSHVLFPFYVAIMLWGGLWLRDSRVAAMFARD